MINIQSRLADLENKVKALKGAYATPGGAVRLIVTKSQKFEINIPSGQTVNIVIEFTPNYIGSGTTITDLKIVDAENMDDILSFYNPVNKIQTGNGKVRMELNIYQAVQIARSYSFKVLATGASTGNFARIS